MKRIFFIISLIIIYAPLSAQEEEIKSYTELSSAPEEEEEEKVIKVEVVKNTSFELADTFGDHEIRLNFFDLLIVPGFHLYYEKIIDQNSSAGIALFARLKDETIHRNFAISPYYRIYFLNRRDYGAKGLFVETFASLASVDDAIRESINITRFSVGLTLGRKWISRQGYTYEPFIGFGRYLDGHSNGENSNDPGHLRFGFSLGKRF